MTTSFGPAADPAISTQGLHRAFQDHVAVRSLDLSVRPGEIYGLLGPNGSGKTTTVRMLTTLLPPTSGTASVAGADVTSQPALVRSRIGAVLQQAGLDPLMTARELIATQAVLQGIPAPAVTRRTSEVIELLNLGDQANRPVARLSGGQRRRVDLAVALVHSPSVLFLDEPTTGLDPGSRRDLWDEIRRRSADGVTVLLTTQYLEEAERMAHRVGLLTSGELVVESSPDELKRNAGWRHLILRFEPGPAAARATSLLRQRGDTVDDSGEHWIRITLGQDRSAAQPGQGVQGDQAVVGRLLALVDAGIEVAAMSIEEPSLEEVFLHLAVAA